MCPKHIHGYNKPGATSGKRLVPTDSKLSHLSPTVAVQHLHLPVTHLLHQTCVIGFNLVKIYNGMKYHCIHEYGIDDISK